MTTDVREPTPILNVPLRVSGLKKEYSFRKGRWGRRHHRVAANSVNFEIPAGTTFALVGSSGSGKSTVARCVTRLERPDAGQIWIHGTDIAPLGSRDLKPFRNEIQMVFQDAATSMNPRFTAGEVIEEPMNVAGLKEANEKQEYVRALMREVGLSPDWTSRLAANFSGGQKQRLAIARALAVRPKVLVLDEALSGLDRSTQAHMANLLLDLQTSRSLAYLLISHDLTLVSSMADFVGVMSEGRIVEQGRTQQIVSSPSQELTKRLLGSVQTSINHLRQALGVSI